MIVLPATMFGNGVEVICRYRAVGSFLRRYGMYAEEGQPLDAYVEVTLKDDLRNDPLITDEGLEMLGIMTKEEYKILTDLTRKIAKVVKDELAKKNIELYDIKFEFGRVGEDKHIALIDEISGGNMRAYKNGKYILKNAIEDYRNSKPEYKSVIKGEIAKRFSCCERKLFANIIGRSKRKVKSIEVYVKYSPCDDCKDAIQYIKKILKIKIMNYYSE